MSIFSRIKSFVSDVTESFKTKILGFKPSKIETVDTQKDDDHFDFSNIKIDDLNKLLKPEPENAKGEEEYTQNEESYEEGILRNIPVNTSYNEGFEKFKREVSAYTRQ